jgi:hypothetical protein
VLISRGIKSSLQRELDFFYRETSQSEFNIRQVTKGAFSQARAKLNPSAFIEMTDNIVNTFYSEAPYKLWKGMRLLSVDGSRLMLPNHSSVKEEFGTHSFGPNADQPRSIALTSILYDVLNLITIDAQIAPYSSSESDLLYKHLDKVTEGDLLLMDRGYPSFALFFLLTAKKINFCVRMKEDWWLEVKKFSESGEKERIVAFKLPKKDKDKLQDYPEIINQTIRCRLIRIELENGEKEILCTSLIDQKEYPYEEFADLYHYRWNIEEVYKLYKARVDMEDFSGKTAWAVKQDFFAKVFTMSLCAVLAFPIDEKIKKEQEKSKNKHQYKINRTSAFAMTRNISVGLFIRKNIMKALIAFDMIVENTLEIIRPNRHVERKKKPKRQYHMNYKQL